MHNNRRLSWKNHLLIALLLGFVVRSLTAYFAFGSQSNDDYSHGILPALALAEGVELKIPNWRSPLLVWTLTPIVFLGQQIGISSQFGLIQFILFALGAFSMLGLFVYGIWGRERGGLVGLYLLALHFLMSFGSTRAFGESIAMTFTLVGFLWLWASEDENGKLKNQTLFVAGALSLGLACLYRFQIGVLAVGFAFYFAFTRRWAQLSLLVAAGLVSAGLQALVDLNFSRKPLETLYNYLYINKDGATEHSDQPWINTWITLLPIWLFPISIPLLKHVKSFDRTSRLWLGLIFLFVALHSMIPHKEERFLFPIVPLMLILLAQLWNKSWNSFGEKYFFRPLALIVLGFALFLSSFSNSQSGEYEPFRRAQAIGRLVLIWDNQSLLRESNFLWSFVGGKVHYLEHAYWPDLAEVEKLEKNDLLFATSLNDQIPSLQLLAVALNSAGWQCSEIDKIQSLTDFFLFTFNPKFNHRRKPTWIMHCQRGKSSAAKPLPPSPTGS